VREVGEGEEEEEEGEEEEGGEEEEQQQQQTFRIFFGIDVFTFVAHHVGFCCYVTIFSELKMYVIVS
jgi:hypothetical protein